MPRGYEVAANGFLRDVDERGGRSTWEWVAREPMASYLATIDIGFWDVHRWRTDDGLPVYDAVDSRAHRASAARPRSTRRWPARARSSTCSRARSGRIRSAPSAAIVDNQDDLFFALETQTRPVYSKLFWLDREGNVGQRRRRRRPRARPPVVRRRRRARPLAGHLAQRGLRDLRRVAVGRARGPGDAAGDLPRQLCAYPGRRPVLGGRDRRPGRRPAVRQRGLRARRDDPAGAARGGRRRRLLRDRQAVGVDARAAATGRRRSSSRSPSRSRGAARRALRHLAVHRRTPGARGSGPRPARGLRARARTRPAGSIRCRRGWRAAATEPPRGRGREPGALGGAPRERPRYARSL